MLLLGTPAAARPAAAVPDSRPAVLLLGCCGCCDCWCWWGSFSFDSLQCSTAGVSTNHKLFVTHVRYSTHFMLTHVKVQHTVHASM